MQDILQKVIKKNYIFLFFHDTHMFFLKIDKQNVSLQSNLYC